MTLMAWLRELLRSATWVNWLMLGMWYAVGCYLAGWTGFALVSVLISVFAVSRYYEEIQ